MSKDDIKQRVRKAVRRMPSRDKIQKIYLFGSHLHGDPREDSDVDLLIDLSDAVGFFTLSEMERTLSEAVGAPVDLVTRGGLSKYLRPKVEEEAELLYEG